MKWVLIAAVLCTSVEQGVSPRDCRTIPAERMELPRYYPTRKACVDAVRGEFARTVAWANEAAGFKIVQHWNFQAICGRAKG